MQLQLEDAADFMEIVKKCVCSPIMLMAVCSTYSERHGSAPLTTLAQFPRMAQSTTNYYYVNRSVRFMGYDHYDAGLAVGTGVVLRPRGRFLRYGTYNAPVAAVSVAGQSDHVAFLEDSNPWYACTHSVFDVSLLSDYC